MLGCAVIDLDRLHIDHLGVSHDGSGWLDPDEGMPDNIWFISLRELPGLFGLSFSSSH